MTHTLTNPKIVSAMLEEQGIRLSHALGQNFLVNSAIIDKILQLAEVSAEDEILEVGPGIGALTVALLETGANVVSIEKDSRLKPLLLKNVEFAKDRFILIEGDALDVVADAYQFLKKSCCGIASDNMASNLAGGCPRSVHFINEHKALLVSEANKLVANLPYNIAATLVLDVFANMETINSATVMVQKEVAERMNAKVGTKNYGAYTVKLQLYAEVAGSFFVGRNNFLPAPRVDSAVIRLNRKEVNLSAKFIKNACIAADAAFFNRRKTILNSCRTYFSENLQPKTYNLKPTVSNVIENWLESCNIDPKIRGEKLTVEDYMNLGIQFEKFFNKCNNE